MEWILDDGHPDGEHRNLLFSHEFKFIGIASGPHKDHQRITCVILVNEFEEHNNEPKHTNVQEVSLPKSHTSILDLVVEGLLPLHNENATLLKINSFGCELDELTVEVHNDGNELFLKRGVIIDGVHTDLVTRIKLPDKVTKESSSASYDKKEKNGELVFRMGQLINDFVGTYEICEYTIEGDPNSQKDSIEFDISQTNDAFIFVPKEKCKSSCRITASLENNTLKFMTTIDGEDVTKVRTIKIPIPISPSQVLLEEFSIGKKITINKKPHLTEHQPDFALTIAEL